MICCTAEPLFQKLSLLAHSSQAEERQDIYVSCSEGIGAKLRGGGEGRPYGIELKSRKERKKRGAELWEKVSSFGHLCS
jgi:hypothetical protein